MASQEKLREMFNGMNTEQKGNFIDNLKKSLEGSDDVESAEFLDECIAVYTTELEMDSATEPVDPEVLQMLDDVSEIAAQDLEIEPVELEPLDPEVIQMLDDIGEIAAQEPGADILTDDVAELEPELELEPEVEPEIDFADMTETMDIEAEIDDVVIEESVEESVEIPAGPKNKVDFIEMEISELADNIRYKMSIIDTISHLLSGTGDELIKAAAQLNAAEPDLPLESTSAYESKVDHTEVSISEFADGIRHDMKVMEAISNLLSGAGN